MENSSLKTHFACQSLVIIEVMVFKSTSLHKFRHTFARKYLIDCGGNAFTLQKLLGHSTLEMTKHYCAIFNADILKGFDNISPLEQMNSSVSKKAHNACS